MRFSRQGLGIFSRMSKQPTCIIVIHKVLAVADIHFGGKTHTVSLSHTCTCVSYPDILLTVPLPFEISSLASYFLFKNLAIEPPPPKPLGFPMTIVDVGMDVFLMVTTGSPGVEYDQYLTLVC